MCHMRRDESGMAIVKLDNDIFDSYDRDLMVATIMAAFEENGVDAATLTLALDTEPANIMEMFGRKRPSRFNILARAKWDRDIVIFKNMIREALEVLQEGDVNGDIKQLIIRQYTE